MIKPISAFYHHIIAKKIQRFSPKTILDIGGVGKLKQYLEYCSITDANKCKGFDGTKLPFKNNSFDLTVSVVTLEHVGNQDKQFLFLQEAYRVARLASIHLFPLGSGATLIENFKKEIHHNHPCVILKQEDFTNFLHKTNIAYNIEIVDTIREHLIAFACTFPQYVNNSYLDFFQNLDHSLPYCILLELIKCP